MFTRSENSGVSLLPAGHVAAYFCAEYGITDKLPIYSGGLGVLAGDIVQEAAARNLSFVPIGLFYKFGFFHQHVDLEGQHESVTQIKPEDAPLELLKDASGETVLIEVPIQERTVYAQVWMFKVGSVTLYLLDTDHWKNNDSDKSITDQLYGGDQAHRIMQELVLGIGGFRLLEHLKIEPSVYHMNEGHSAFLSLELTQSLMKKGGLDLEAARKAAHDKLVFTNHTLVVAGNDAFPHDQIRYFLGKYAHESGLGIDTILSWGNSDNQEATFSMTMLALRMSRKANAVSWLHAEKALSLWPTFPLAAITNGVHLPAWIAPELQQELFSVAPEWNTNSANIKVWSGVRHISYQRFWEIHTILKRRMLQEVKNRTGVELREDVLTIVWARRFASYKRPDLLFSDVERLKKLLFSADKPIQIIVAGKSHPADGQGKEIIKHIENLAEGTLEHRAVFVDDYSISLSKFLVSGADVWLNTPIYGLEASGTSGMKAAANGVVQFTTPDGWAHEVDWFGMGYTLPLDKAESEIYNLFEKKIIPTYYRRTRENIPELWAAMMKETMASVAPTFSATRMLNEYVKTLYLDQ